MADRDDSREPEDVTLRLNARLVAGRNDLPVFVYRQLKLLAHRQLRKEFGGATLSTTALVHDAWLEIGDKRVWQDRSQFYRHAATAMRHILVDQARWRLAGKRGGGAQRIDLAACEINVDDAAASIVGLDHALEALEREQPQLADVVQLRFFAGLSVEDAAQVMGISERSVVRNWRIARAMIYRALELDHVS